MAWLFGGDQWGCVALDFFWEDVGGGLVTLAFGGGQ